MKQSQRSLVPHIPPEELDHYEDPAAIPDPDHKVVVLVECVGEGYEVSRLRDNGSTSACVSWTRAELVELVSRAQAALAMGGDQ